MIGTLAWDVPMLPLHYWRVLHMGELFVFHVPMQVEIQVSLEGEVRRMFQTHSALESLDTDFCRITESVESSEIVWSIRRRIEIDRRFIRGADVAQVPLVLDHIERALELVLSLRT